MLTIGIKTKKLTSKNILLSDMLDEKARLHPEKLAYISADTGASLTFKQTQQLVRKISNVFYDAGYRKGDAVVILMENRLEYVAVWLALSSIGVVACLVNHNLRGESLRHCIAISKCKGIIFSEDTMKSLREIQTDLDAELYCFDECKADDIPHARQLKVMIDSADVSEPPRPAQLSLTEDVLFYMYTSGTTGLPKAVVIRGGKVLFLLMFGRIGMGFQHDDVIYNPLPLYHGNGAIVATHPIVDGNTCVVKRKFNAHAYMEDCCRYNVTVINYIGESCRYILAQPKRDCDSLNKIRLAAGNGLRASIWSEFKHRFNIEKLVELYGCSEGNVGVINNTGKVGAVGFSFVIFPFLNRVKIIKVDRATGAVLRGPNGLAIPAAPGEFGQLVGTVQNAKYEGYVDDELMKKKLAYNIFREGDCVFLSGDVFIQDEEGFFYFQDRTDDTFTWRGEIVSSNAVEGVLSKAVGLADVAVYGVDLPNEDGQAGMACISDPERKIDIDELRVMLERDLPHYARPVFLRMTSLIETTGTFKLQKKKLRAVGFDVVACRGDDMYYYDVRTNKYLVLDEVVVSNIFDGQIHF